MPPDPLPPVSGRYRGRCGTLEVELRVDIDGARPLDRVSADYYDLSDIPRRYAGSMRIDAPRAVADTDCITIAGTARSTWETDADQVSLKIVRGRARGHATLTHSTPSGGMRASYTCTYESSLFRRVLIEEDVEAGVTHFDSYDTSSLRAPCAARTLTYRDAFADAGIEIVRTREPGIVESRGVSWSDAELHAAMEQHFTAFADIPQWAVWLLHANLHDNDGAGRGYLGGLMFDRRGRQRQGCALFYGGLRATPAELPRLQLFTCVHELAHTFNLLHSFEKSRAVPPVPSRPRAASWLAYPDSYPDGQDAFWERFAFEFDPPEIEHLRHAMRDDVIMGGNPLLAGAAFEQDAEEAAARSEDPGVRLDITCAPIVPYGVPVAVDLALTGTTPEGRLVPSCLGPRVGNVEISIRGPGRDAFVFEPLLRHCRLDDAKLLRVGDPPIRDSAFVHYGKDGFAFERPGRYALRASLTLPGDGSFVLSEVKYLDVPPPITRTDRAVAALAFGDEQGTLMSLVGSDAPRLQAGKDALRTIAERYPRHALARVARLVRAVNRAREFKVLRLDGTVKLRPSRPQELAAILGRTPGVEILRAATAGVAAEDQPSVIAAALGRLPTNRAERQVDPFVRSRINEITKVVPQALALTPPAPPEILLTIGAIPSGRPHGY